jgi:hypothetical protein
MRLTLSKGPNRVCVSSPEDGNRSSSRNVVYCSYLQYHMMGKAQKQSDSVVYHRRNPLDSTDLVGTPQLSTLPR